MDRLYRAKGFSSERERVEHLFMLYEKMRALLAAAMKAKPKAAAQKGQIERSSAVMGGEAYHLKRVTTQHSGQELTMNDPHVVALIYHIEHGNSVDFSKAEPLVWDESAFSIKVKDKKVRFELKDHYASEGEARKAIEDYIRVWEFDACLENGPDAFRLNFEGAKIVDRNPPPPVPGVKNIAATFRGGLSGTLTVKLGVVKNDYPPPPSRLKLCPDVQTMYDRYMGYRQGKEPLASMAYFCWSMIKDNPANSDFSSKVGKKINRLSSEKGGWRARKASGKDNDLTAQDRRFLEKAIKAVIRRAAERAYDPEKSLPQISLSDLQNHP